MDCFCIFKLQYPTLFSLQGHLLVVENFDSFHLNHGMMEAGYADHQSASAPGVEERMLSISMTATMDTTGNLVLGNISHSPLKLQNQSGTICICPLHLAIFNLQGAAVSSSGSTLKLMRLSSGAYGNVQQSSSPSYVTFPLKISFVTGK